MWPAIVAAVVSSAVGIFELYRHAYPCLRKRMPELLGVNYDDYEHIAVYVIREQYFKKKWGGMRTIMGLYQDVQHRLDKDLGGGLSPCCCDTDRKRTLNLAEFHQLIVRSPDWRQMRELPPMDHARVTEHRRRALELQPDLPPELVEELSQYFWEVAVPHH
jgi:hypothetical protein